MTMLYRIVVEVIYLTLIVTLITDDRFPKASLPKASFSLLKTACGNSFPSGNLCCKSYFDIMPRVEKSSSPEDKVQMQ